MPEQLKTNVLYNAKGQAVYLEDKEVADKISTEGVDDFAELIDSKVDKVEGKGLSTNDFTDAEKVKLAALGNYDDSELTAALNNKVDKVSGKGLSTEDFTTAEKQKLTTVYTSQEVDALLANKVSTSVVGEAGGVASLGIDGKVPSSQLPSYVDDVLEYANKSSFPETGEAGKIYIAQNTNKTFRWSGSAYVQISDSLALGETSGTAYEGDKGKANADAITAIKDGTTIDSFGDVETALGGKVDTETGKGLSSNDFTDALKTKLEGLSAYDDTALAGRVSDIEDVIPSTATSSNKLATVSDIPSQQTITVDFALDGTSTNPVQNSVITEALNDINDLIPNDATHDNHLVTLADLAGENFFDNTYLTGYGIDVNDTENWKVLHAMQPLEESQDPEYQQYGSFLISPLEDSSFVDRFKDDAIYEQGQHPSAGVSIFKYSGQSVWSYYDARDMKDKYGDKPIVLAMRIRDEHGDLINHLSGDEGCCIEGIYISDRNSINYGDGDTESINLAENLGTTETTITVDNNEYPEQTVYVNNWDANVKNRFISSVASSVDNYQALNNIYLFFKNGIYYLVCFDISQLMLYNEFLNDGSNGLYISKPLIGIGLSFSGYNIVGEPGDKWAEGSYQYVGNNTIEYKFIDVVKCSESSLFPLTTIANNQEKINEQERTLTSAIESMTNYVETSIKKVGLKTATDAPDHFIYYQDDEIISAHNQPQGEYKVEVINNIQQMGWRGFGFVYSDNGNLVFPDVTSFQYKLYKIEPLKCKYAFNINSYSGTGKNINTWGRTYGDYSLFHVYVEDHDIIMGSKGEIRTDITYDSANNRYLLNGEPVTVYSNYENIPFDKVYMPIYIGDLTGKNNIPDCPTTTDGNYVLKCTVSGGVPAYTWVPET